MPRDGDVPAVGGRGLGVRPGHDLDAIHPDDLVEPESGGMSVTPDDPLLAPSFRLPEALGGDSKHPLWSISTDALDQYHLTCRTDRHGHALIEPTETVSLESFQQCLANTAQDWQLEHD